MHRASRWGTMSRRWAMWLWLIVPSVGPAARAEPPEVSEEARVWTLAELMGTIEREHPLMEAARAGLAQLQAKLNQAEWAMFPSFALEAGATLTPEVTGDALASASTWDRFGVAARVKLDMVQPIWTFGKIGALQDAAKAGVEVGKAAVEVARWELRVRTAEAYLGRLLSRELDAILVDGQTWIEKAEKRMEKLRAQDSDEYDQLEHLRLKTRIAEFWQLSYDNKMLVNQSREGLRLLFGRAQGETVDIADKDLEPYEVKVLSPDAYVARARASDPLVMVARRSAKAQRALADAKGAELLPDVVIVGQARYAVATAVEDQQSLFADDPYNDHSLGAGLGLRWKLDVPQRLFAADEARAKARRAEAEAEVQGDLAEFKIRQLALDLKNKQELLVIFAEAQKAAQGWLTASWDTYDAGFGTFRDVMDALVQFYQRKIGYLKLVFDHNILCWRLSQAIGSDIREMISE
jgi:multidrug efflux system outer membrane protein